MSRSPVSSIAAAAVVIGLAVGACGSSGPVVKVLANNGVGTDAYRFSPDKLSIPQGGSIELLNAGDVEHNLTIDNQGIVIYTGVGQTNQATVNLPPGTYRFQCTIVEGGSTHGARGMRGTLTVTAKP
jgi:plastocyanin